ncbi:MAG: RNA-binding transcriptional accessory protein [Pseudoflavonifractor sp.]|nr:RNA-binding transcriptional accessory protein [Pseudoflavonifractor sp.]
MSTDISKRIAREMGIAPAQVDATVRLLDGGATIPFISRYRKEMTGGLDEVAVLNIKDRYRQLREFESRKEYVISKIEEQGVLTPELRERIVSAPDATALEDIYQPYKPKRRTRAAVARERGLEPLARMIMSQKREDVAACARRFVGGEVESAEAALAGASDIIAEWVADDVRSRAMVRSRMSRNGTLRSVVVKGKETSGSNYANYFDYSVALRTCGSHRFLAMQRGSNDGVLRVSVEIDDDDMAGRLGRLFVKPGCPHNVADLISRAVADGYKRLLRPSIENEVMAAAKEKADDHAISLFADNVRQLLFASPLGHKRVLAIDPGFRTGCKVVCLDEQGNLLHNDVIYPHEPRNDFHGAARKISYLIEAYRIDAIAVGNGTAGRETERFLGRISYPRDVKVYSVNEDGASIYSASKIAREEFPDKDVTVRGAVSIGRRLIDPLAELVKIEPRSIGVGQYQHDIDQTRLRAMLGYVVESCVNAVGVNVNTASRELLSYVSGIGPALAENIVKYRAEHGDFRSRQELLDVPRLGARAFQQSAGFLRIPGAGNLLDNTAVHPESYPIVERMARDCGCKLDDFVKDKTLRDRIEPEKYVDDTVGLPTINDIMAELEKPGRDPRTQVKVMEFDENVRAIGDVKPGMELNGIVNNVTAFGAFVDIGIKESGLVHISELSDRFVSSPSEVVSLNQHVRVRVLDVDHDRKRISLSMKGLGR